MTVTITKFIQYTETVTVEVGQLEEDSEKIEKLFNEASKGTIGQFKRYWFDVELTYRTECKS